MKLTEEQLRDVQYAYARLQDRIEMIEDDFWWELCIRLGLDPDEDMEELKEQTW